MKLIKFLAVVIIGAALVLLLLIIGWHRSDEIATVSAVTEKEDISLKIEVIEGNVLYKTDDTIVLLAPAKYKVVRAAYGDDCWYNLVGRTTYGLGEDVISINDGTYEYTYIIVCQPLIGKGEVTSVSKTVIVVAPTELHSAESVLLSQ